jgi:hypothetical protein
LAGKIRTINNPVKEDQTSFDWLIGLWENAKTKNSFEEWKKGDENSLVLGQGFRTIKDDRIISEYIQIKKDGDRFIYEARLPHLGDHVPFQLIQINEGGFVCENPDFDFPKRISYELEGYDTLTVHLFGARKKVVFKFKKSK